MISSRTKCTATRFPRFIPRTLRTIRVLVIGCHLQVAYFHQKQCATRWEKVGKFIFYRLIANNMCVRENQIRAATRILAERARGFSTISMSLGKSKRPPLAIASPMLSGFQARLTYVASSSMLMWSLFNAKCIWARGPMRRCFFDIRSGSK